ncbi:MAG: hypothetical protein V3T21_01370 [Candidatus Margulisiibacteriota bacterium]
METQQSMAVWDDLDVQNKEDRSDDTREICYRPFIYGAESKAQIWAKKVGFGIGMLKDKWFKLLGH